MSSLPRLVAHGALARRRSLAVLLLLLGAGGVQAAPSFVEFESGQVRPLALSPDASHLFAVNTPDNRLEIFDVSGGGLGTHTSVPVGLEPVAVAARTNTEVWVVNHLSDCVSIVDVSSSPPRVTPSVRAGGYAATSSCSARSQFSTGSSPPSRVREHPRWGQPHPGLGRGFRGTFRAG